MTKALHPIGCAFALCILGTAVANAQIPAGAPRIAAESASVVPGPEHRAGPFGRFLFGDHYRDLWTTRLRAPVLSLDTFGGGLRPVRRGGSRQTKALHFAGGDGRQYVFRSVDKDASLSLPVELRGTYASRIVQDIISAALPGGALIVAGLLDVTGVLHATPQLAVMPDDARLGEFRQDFAGLLGLIEVRPAGPADDDDESDMTGFAGAIKVVSSEKLYERITEDPEEQVDAQKFLAARLFDIFVGDWDRHPDQWRWARFGDAPSDRWQPIPRDRDWAFVKLDGLVWSLSRTAYPFPQFVSFDASYPDLVWLTWTARRLDRRILSALERPAWDSIAGALRAQLTDAAIDQAIERLPFDMAQSSAGRLRQTLVARRDHLSEAAHDYYRMLADEVELHGTDESEIVEVTRADARHTTVTIRQRTKSGAPRARVWLARRFDAGETREIRIYLHGGDDRVVSRGAGSGHPLVRIIGGGGTNTFADSSRDRSGIRYYDTNVGSTAGPDADIDRREYKEPKTRRGWIDPARDWGSRWRPLPWVSYSPIVGLFVGGGPLYKRYGFREHPYAYSTSMLAGYATGANRFRAQFQADVRRSNSNVRGTLLARYSGIDILRFYGYGNETSPAGPSRFHAVDQRVVSLEPLVHFPVGGDLSLSMGASMRYATTALETGRFITSVKPYGTGAFGQVGAREGIVYDTRDVPENASRGAFVSIQGAQYPAVWSATGAFASLRSQASTYLRGRGLLEPVLALRGGGDKLWGQFPFSDAAFVGGESTVRGLVEQRYAGSASLYGNAELRVHLAKIFLLLPGDLGAFGLADAGRVYQSGETSDLWHQAFGGGLWVSFLDRANTFSLAYAHSRERNGVYFRTGLLF